MNHKRGVTLLELIIYVAIFIVVAGLVVSILFVILRVQSQSTSSREVSEQGRFVLERIKREVRSASLIDISTTTPEAKLILRMKESSRDYVAFYASGTAIYMDEGTSDETTFIVATTTNRLTNKSVDVEPNSLSFKRLHKPPAKDAVEISFTLSYNSSVPGSAFTKKFKTTADRVSAAVFNSNLLPTEDQKFDIGSSTLSRWRDARFSINVGVGANEADIKTADVLVLGTQSGSTDEGGQVKLLSPAPNSYSIFDNYQNHFRIITGGGGDQKERVRITEGGPVLIGINTNMVPAEKLEIIGNIISKGTEWTTKQPPAGAEGNSWGSVAYGNGLFVAVAWSGGDHVMTSPDGINWTAHDNPAIDSREWFSVTYANGLFVSVGNGSSGAGDRVMTSPDGKNWTLRTTPVSASRNWRTVTYANGLFVAAAIDATPGDNIMTSPDGVNWQTHAAPANNEWKSIAYGKGSDGVNRFVAVSEEGSFERVMTSTDGITWALQSTPLNGESLRAVTYGNGRFVAVSFSGINRAMTSADGITWAISATPQPGRSWHSITYGNGLFVAVASSLSSTCFGSCIMTSPDGVNWTLRRTPADANNNNWYSITYGNGLFVAVARTGSNSRILISGKTDYQVLSHDNIYQGGMKILGGNVGAGTTAPVSALHVVGNSTVTDDVSLSSNNKSILGRFASGFASILKINSSDVLDIGSSGSLVKAVRFLAGSLSSRVSFETAGSERVRVDQSGRVGVSAAEVPEELGSSWVTRATPEANAWRSVTYGTPSQCYGGPPCTPLFVAVSNSISGDNTAFTVRIMTSPDGITWTIRKTPATATLAWQSVAYGNGRFVAVASTGSSNRVMYSDDGVNWTQVISGVPDFDWSSVTFGGGKFVAVASVGTTRAMYSENNGEIWVLGSGLSSARSWQSVTYNGSGRFVAVANNGCGTNVCMAYSDNGISWTAASSIRAGEWTSVTFGGGKFVAVEVNVTNTIASMYSAEGITWIYSSSGPPVAKSWRSVTYNGSGRFVAVASNACDTGSCVAYSDTGTSWTSVPSGNVPVVNENWWGVTFGGGKFVAVSNSGKTGAAAGRAVMISTSGSTGWTQELTTAQLGWKSSAYGSGLFVAVADCNSGNCVMTSPDGIVWNLRNTPSGSWTSVIFANGFFLAVASGGTTPDINRVMTSPDGITWTSRTAAALIAWQSVTYGYSPSSSVCSPNSAPCGIFTAVASTGSGNQVMTSSDNGASWVLRSTPSVPTTNTWFGITYGNISDSAVCSPYSAPCGAFVAVSNSGVNGERVMTSPDGEIWTRRITSPVPDNAWRSVTFGNGRFVSVSPTGSGVHVMYSNNGRIWSVAPPVLLNNWYSVTYTFNSFVAVANCATGVNQDTCAMTSPDGESWTAYGTPARNNWNAVAYKDYILVSVAGSGSGNLVMTSGVFFGGGPPDPRVNLHIDSIKPRLALSAGTLDATNPAWVLTDQSSDGLLKIQSTSDYSTYTDRVTIDSSGMVGIGTAPTTYRLTLPNTSDNAGKGVANGWIGLSSVRWKTNIQDIKDALQKVLELRGVTFDWKPENGGTRDIGLIAEEVGKILPDIVEWEENGVDAIGLDYGRLVAVLIEAIKERQSVLDNLENRVLRLEMNIGVSNFK